MISMRAKIFAAATLSALVLASPALAGGWGYRGGWGGGWGHGGWGYGRGGWGGGPGWGAAAAVGALGGLAVGLAASQAAAYPYYYPPRCRVVSQPVFDGYGYVVGYQPVQVCG